MQTWAKRGLQGALVTGGLLMLGTGIASAQENVNPDKPAGPLDLSVAVPIHTQDNVLGTPLGQVKLPDFNQEIKTPSLSSLTGSLPKNPVSQTVSDVNQQAGKAMTQATPKTGTQAADDGDVFHGNKVVGNVAVPIEICGNAIAAGGPAKVEGSCDQTYEHRQDIKTTSNHKALGGNVVNVDYAAPVQITGNAIGGFAGNAESTYAAKQRTQTVGDIETDGTHTSGSGNVVAAHPVTPIELNGLAASGALGAAHANSTTDNFSRSGGYIKSDGNEGAVNGNVAGAPVALPVELNNIAGSVAGGHSETGNGELDAPNGGTHVTDSRAGATSPNEQGLPMYAQTSGKHTVLGGNMAQPELAGPVQLCGIAAADKIADSHANCNSTNKAVAGGGALTFGNESLGGGNVAHSPISLPVDLCGIAGSAFGALSKADCQTDKTTSLTGGKVDRIDGRIDGNSYTQGDKGAAAGNIVSTPLASAVDLCGIGGSYIGLADAKCKKDIESRAGGYDGNTGNDSSVSGNIVQTPLAVPAELVGIGASHIGQGNGEGSEKKIVDAGGDTNTIDDNGFGSSNVASVPGALPIQIFGVGATYVGQAHGKGTTDSDVKAGGKGHASGNKSSASGNIITAPLAGPTQIFGIGASHIGNAIGEGFGKTHSKAGGDNTATGKDSSIAGNIVEVPTGYAAQIFGDAASFIGNSYGDSTNDNKTESGGKATTIGDNGAATGNVVAAPLNPIAQIFGVDAHAAGVGHGHAISKTDDHVGGDIVSSGKKGALAGNAVYTPAQAIAQIFGNGVVPGVGIADGSAVNDLTAINGGNVKTDGTDGSAAGNVIAAQAQPIARIFGNAVGVVGNVTGTGVDKTNVKNGGDLTTVAPTGSAAGNILDVPAVAAPQIFGNGVGVLSTLTDIAGDDLNATNGGKDTTSPSNSNGLTGVNSQLPVGLVPEVFNFKLPVLSTITSTVVHKTNVINAGKLVPSIPLLGTGLPGAGVLPSLPALPGTGATGTLPTLPALPGGNPSVTTKGVKTQAAPVATTVAPIVAKNPAYDGGLTGAPKAPGLPGLPSLPKLPGVPDTSKLITLDLGNLTAPLKGLTKGGLPSLPSAGNKLPKLPGLDALHVSGPAVSDLQKAVGKK